MYIPRTYIELWNQPTAYVVSERVNMTYHLNNDEINIDRHDDDTDTPHQNPPKPAAWTKQGPEPVYMEHVYV